MSLETLLRDYLQSSNIHGLAYLIESKNVFVRCVWLVCICTGLSCAAFIIYNTIDGWTKNPTMISSVEVVPIKVVLNKIKKNLFFRILTKGAAGTFGRARIQCRTDFFTQETFIGFSFSDDLPPRTWHWQLHHILVQPSGFYGDPSVQGCPGQAGEVDDSRQNLQWLRFRFVRRSLQGLEPIS